MSARDEAVEAAHRAYHLVEMGHEMPEGIELEIEPRHAKALAAAVAAVEALTHERIAVAIEAAGRCSCTDAYCAQRSMAKRAARIARCDT